MKSKSKIGAMAGILVLGALSLAADHREAPGATADGAADIADIYAWHDAATNKLYAFITYAGLLGDLTQPIYDRNVLYTVNIDNDQDNESDIDVNIQFAPNGFGEVGVRVENLPGAAGTVIGPVEQILTSGTARVFAGVKDDPFFFDSAGFRDTLATGTLMFDSSRDGFAGFNVMVIALEMDLAQAQTSGNNLRLWATTGRRQP